MAQELSAMMRVLRHNLVSDAAVYGTVGSGVFTAHTRDAEEATRNQPTVIVELRAGSVAGSSPVTSRTAWVYTYSNRSMDEARKLHDDVAAVLRRRGLQAQLDAGGDPCEPMCLYARETAAALEGYNDVVGGWFVRSTYAIHTQG